MKKFKVKSKTFNQKDELEFEEDIASSKDLESYATKQELEYYATKQELSAYATKEEVQTSVSNNATQLYRYRYTLDKYPSSAKQYKLNKTTGVFEETDITTDVSYASKEVYYYSTDGSLASSLTLNALLDVSSGNNFFEKGTITLGTGRLMGTMSSKSVSGTTVTIIVFSVSGADIVFYEVVFENASCSRESKELL